MNGKTKILLIVAGSLALVGSVIFCCVLMAVNWDFTKLSTSHLVTNTYDITGDIENISISVTTADVAIVHTEDGKCRVVCLEWDNEKHEVASVDGNLSVSYKDTRKWYEHIGITHGQSKITVFLPKGAYGNLVVSSHTGDVEIAKDKIFDGISVSGSTCDVRNEASATGAIKIKVSTGDVYMENISAGWLDVAVSTGEIKVSNINCNGEIVSKVSTGKSYFTNANCTNLNSAGSTGEITLTNVVASGKISIERSTGDVKLDGVDAGELLIKTDTGDVTGNLLTEKIFITKTSTGDVDVPKTTTGGKCEITTSTGDIKIKVQ